LLRGICIKNVKTPGCESKNDFRNTVSKRQKEETLSKVDQRGETETEDSEVAERFLEGIQEVEA
jgi:hypothetical protein